MRYVALIHKEPDTVYGVTIPDVPGCFSAGETLDDALRNAAEAVLFHTEGQALPTARDAETVMRDPALQDVIANALVATVEVNPAERRLVPLDPSLLDAVDVAARKRGISRVDFVRSAVEAALADR